MDKLIAVADVAEALGISSRQVWKLTASGRLPTPLRLGRSVRWRETDLVRFMQARCDMQAFEAQPSAGRRR